MTRLLPVLAIMAVMAFASRPSIAQTASRNDMKHELLQRALREKLRLPGHFADNERGEKTTTAATDGRVSTTSSSVDEAEISLAYNPTDSNKIVLSYMEEGAAGLKFPIYYSSDGGASWTKSTFNSTGIMNADFPGMFAGGGGDPVFAWDKNGTVYFGWIYVTIPSTFDTGYFSLNWAYSTDNGHTWNVKPKHFVGQGVIDLTGGGLFPIGDGVTDREWFAVDNSGGPHQGNLYCSFVCFPPGAAPIFEAVKTKLPGVDTFGQAVHAFDGNTQFGNLEVDKNGTLHMSFADMDVTKVKHTKSTDGGNTFSVAVVVGGAASLFPDPPFVVHNRENGAPNLAVDGASGTGNNAYVTWSEYPGTTVNSFFSHSTDGGNTWSTPMNLNSLTPGKFTFMPTVAGEGSSVALSFTAIDSSDSARYYQLNSTDYGATFPTLRLLSSQPCNYLSLGAADTNSNIFFGDYNRSARTQCFTYAAWEDCRNNVGAKVYFAKSNYCTVGIKEVTLVNGDAQLLSVYPNPASEMVNLKLSLAKAQNLHVAITDIAGRTALTGDYKLQSGEHSVTMSLHGMAKGMYTLSVSDEEGMIATRPLIIH